MTDQTAARRDMANAIRALSMDAVQQADSGHPGMPMGMADIATVLFAKFLKFDPADSQWPDRDRFVLCKGHAALALYAAMRHTGRMTEEALATYCADGTHLGVHPEACLEGIDVATGSLGQGLSVACGLAVKKNSKTNCTFVGRTTTDEERR